MNEWNEWLKSYIAHVSSRRLFRALNIESNLAIMPGLASFYLQIMIITAHAVGPAVDVVRPH